MSAKIPTGSLSVFTRLGSSFGLALIAELQKKGVTPDLLVVECTTWTKRFRQARFLSRKIGVLSAIYYNFLFWYPVILRSITAGIISPVPSYQNLAKEVLYVKDINDPLVYSRVKSLQIQKILLGQSGIVKGEILSDPSLAIINAHPGKIPLMRGVDVIKWALLEERPVEITVHLIDSGVDTGPVLYTEPVEIYPDDSIEDIEKRAAHRSVELLSEFGSGQRDSLSVAQKHLDNEVGPQRYLMPLSVRRSLYSGWPKLKEARLKTGQAS